MVMMLNQCCCCCSLYTGTIIIGVLNTLGGLGYLIIGTAAAVAAGAGAIEPLDEDSKIEVVALGAVIAVLGAILLLVSICLIIGADKGNPRLLVPWLVYGIVFLIASTIIYIDMTVEYFETGNTIAGAGYIVGTVITFLLETYFLLVVYSLYRVLKGTAPPDRG